MASRRQLGGGRILGNGKSLSPAAAAPRERTPNGLHSPSPSSVSLNSQLSHTSPPSSLTETQDLSARVSLEPPSQEPATASTRLVCPICDEEMMTLLQLNRHLDDLHQNLEEIEQDEVKTWFRTQMVKAKKFQPLAVLNQKLRALDVFESNDSTIPNPATSNGNSSYAEPSYIDPDDVITKTHWQRARVNDTCSEPMCGKRLGSGSGTVNCRKCGKLFCEEHTMYQMKLSRSAQHEPVRGFWCRVCETCYKSREGYNDYGFFRSHTDEFSRLRSRYINKQYMETSRLEKRLTKLTQLMVDPSFEPIGAGSIWPIYNSKSQRRAMEQNIVAWEDDVAVSKCRFCQQEFTSYTFRRHHCRTCGRVVCGDPETACSTEVGLNVDAPALQTSEKDKPQLTVDIRMCRDCIHTVFSRQDFERESTRPRPDQRAYTNLLQFEQGIRFLLPKFQKLLLALQDPENPPQPSQLSDATRVRKRLLDSFTQYDIAARRIRDLPTTSPTQKRLQVAIYHKASSFLHTHMLPLKSLPKLLKHASPHGLPTKPKMSSSTSTLTPNRPSASALSLIDANNSNSNSNSQNANGFESMSTASSSVLSAMESEEKKLRERLIVLEEQKFLVGQMADDAKKKRKFDEASALASNVLELSGEIDQIHGMLGRLDFEGLYTAGGLDIAGIS